MFHFRHFDLEHDNSTLKIGTDAVLLATVADVLSSKRVLDVGCGCGVVAFCIAQRIASNNPEITGIDIDQASIEECIINANNFGLLPAYSFSFEKTSFQEFAAREHQHSFDLIISNPPFFHGDLKPSDDKRLRSKHGDGSLSFNEIVNCSDRLLDNNGRLAVILPAREADEFQEIAKNKFFCIRKTSVKPTVKKPIFRIILEFSRNYSETEEHLFSIRDEAQKYTQGYLDLVHDYLFVK